MEEGQEHPFFIQFESGEWIFIDQHSNLIVNGTIICNMTLHGTGIISKACSSFPLVIKQQINIVLSRYYQYYSELLIISLEEKKQEEEGESFEIEISQDGNIT